MSGLKVIFSVLTLPHFFLILSCLPFQIPNQSGRLARSLLWLGDKNCCLDSQQKLLKKKSCGVSLFISGSLGFGNKSIPYWPGKQALPQDFRFGGHVPLLLSSETGNDHNEVYTTPFDFSSFCLHWAFLTFQKDRNVSFPLCFHKEVQSDVRQLYTFLITD